MNGGSQNPGWGDGDGGRLLVLFAMPAQAPLSGPAVGSRLIVSLRQTFHYQSCHNRCDVRCWDFEKMLLRQYETVKIIFGFCYFLLYHLWLLLLYFLLLLGHVLLYCTALRRARAAWHLPVSHVNPCLHAENRSRTHCLRK